MTVVALDLSGSNMIQSLRISHTSFSWHGSKHVNYGLSGLWHHMDFLMGTDISEVDTAYWGKDQQEKILAGLEPQTFGKVMHTMMS